MIGVVAGTRARTLASTTERDGPSCALESDRARPMRAVSRRAASEGRAKARKAATLDGTVPATGKQPEKRLQL